MNDTRKIAVVGLSPVSARPSYGVTRDMISHGYEIYDVFRNPEAVPALVDELEKWMRTLPEGQKPRCLWLQEGVGNPDAEEKARKLGLQVVSNLCILKEHARLL